MPFKSPKQERLMRGVAHSPSFAKKVGIPQSVGKKFVQDAKEGNEMKSVKKMMGGGMYAAGGMPMVEKDGKKIPAFAADGKGKMAKGGMAGMHKMPNGKMMKNSEMPKPPMKKMASGGLSAGHKQADGVATKGKTKGAQVKMRKGGYC
jgi:hypothetical protein